MTSVSSASPSVICQEVFDDGYQPSAEEINEYAIKIGIDPGKELHLLYLAKEGLIQALPPDWKICYNDEIQAHYYYNVQTKASQWDHPLDSVYRALVEQARQKQASTAPPVTNSVIDVSDDASQLDSGIRSLQGNEESELNIQDPSPLVNFKANMNRFLEGREKRLLNHDPIKNSRFEVVKTSPQIGLDMRFNPDSGKSLDFNRKTSDDDEKRLTGYAISGTGSMFLKSNVKRVADAPQKNFIDWSKDTTNRGKNLFAETLGPSVKGILRDSSLTDVRRKFDDTENEDRKSVRFNLEEIKKDNFSPEEDPSSSRKFGPSPEVSENSDDDDPWDFMEDQEEEKHVKEVKVIPVNRNPPVKILKPVLKPHISSDEILNKPQNKLLSIGRAFSADIVGEKSSSSILDKMKERNLVKPLYEDTDSDSRGSSIRSFILKTGGEDHLDSIDYKNEDLEKLRKENEQKILELKQRFQEEREAEEKKLREEMSQILETKKEELILENEKSLSALKREFKNESLNEMSEEIVTREKQEIDNQIAKEIELHREERETQKKERIQTEKVKFEKLLQAEIEELQREYNQKILDVQHEYNVKLDVAKKDLDIEQSLKLNEYRSSLQEEFEVTRKAILEEHKVTVDTLQQNHAEILQELERDLKSEEEILKKEHAGKLVDMKDKLAHEMELERQRMRESGEDRLYEKMRCEKRLLEDKYRCLKEKYIRLKTDVKLSLERRNRRREQQGTQQQSLNTTTGSETERSTSNKPSIGNSENRSATVSSPYPELSKPPATPKGQSVKEHIREKSNDRNQSKDRKLGIASKYIKQLQSHYQDDATSISQSDTTISNNYPRGRYLPAPFSDNGNSDSEAFKRNQENNNNPRERQRKKLFSRMKSASTSRLNTENFKVDRPCTPVESLRRQLQKLEDLEDQFPDNTLDTTYHLRYPFSDISNDRAGASSELEFFKHRIHLERDSVRRAKESLRTQRTNFRARQREIKQRHKMSSTRHTLDQLIQEERELTEMEVNLHRTRALLGEKVIRLRHLEQSLQRIYEKEKPVDFLHIENKDDATLSDLSSHSSSGFSSTDFASDTNQANVNRRKEMYQESSECIQNLEILNAEIREILDILSRQQTHGLTPPPQIGNPELNWALLSPSAPPANTPTPLLHAPQSIPTLADRLETYRQLAAGRMQTSMSGAVMAANTIVSQNPRAVNYTTSLVERTRDLRNWLRQAKNEHDILTSGNIGANIGNGPGQQANL